MEKQVKPKERTAYVVMAAFDFNLISNIRKAREKLDYSQEELSFLFGREKKYVSTIEDPTNKKKYDLSHLNFYGKVLGRLPRKLISKSKTPGAFIRINSKCIEFEDKVRCEVEEVLEDGTASPLFSFEESVSSDYSPKDQAITNDVVTELFEAGYFDTHRFPFETFQLCKEKLKKKFKPKLLMEALAVYTRRKRAPRLVIGKSEEGWVLYQKF